MPEEGCAMWRDRHIQKDTKYILCGTQTRLQQLIFTRNMQGSSPIGLHEPLRYGLGICPVSAWLAKLATISSNICDRVRSCIRANFGAEYEARSPFTIFVSSHSLTLKIINNLVKKEARY